LAVSLTKWGGREVFYLPIVVSTCLHGGYKRGKGETAPRGPSLCEFEGEGEKKLTAKNIPEAGMRFCKSMSSAGGVN
jgi:hypothetical protein